MGKRTYDMVLSAIGATLIVIGSMISVNAFAVPFTLQTMAIFIVLMSIGGKRGSISILVYLLLGAVGIPVFAGFKGGPAVLMGPTGGFLIGFIFVGLLWWLLADRFISKTGSKAWLRIVLRIVMAVFCEVAMYAFGVVWFMTVYASQTGPVGLSSALTMCVFPFIIPDIVKIAVAASASEACAKVVKD